MKKRLLLIVAVLVSSFVMVTSAFAQGTTSGYCGSTADGADAKLVTWSFTPTDGTLTISGIGKTNDYDPNDPAKKQPWSEFLSSITSIIINEGVDAIGIKAFQDCVNLTYISIPKSLSAIHNDAFANCNKRKKVNFQNLKSWFMMNIYNLEATPLNGGADLCVCGIPLNRQQLRIPEGIEILNEYSLRYTNFDRIVLPKSLKQIHSNAFAFLNMNELIALPTSEPYILGGSFQNLSSNKPMLYVDRGVNGYDSYEWTNLYYEKDEMHRVRYVNFQVYPNMEERGVTIGEGVYKLNENIQIQAVPYKDYRFIKWSDDITENPRTVKAGYKEITAIFEPVQHTITVVSDNEDMGTASGGGTFDIHTYITIEAKSKPNYIFSKWNDGNTENPRTVAVKDDAAYTAFFALDTFSISLSSADAAMGSVSGQGDYAYGSQQTISATPEYGYLFSKWDDGNTENPRSITVLCDASYTAHFIPDTFNITVTSADVQQGSVSGAGRYPYLSEQSVSAAPAYGYRFARWTDGNTENPRKVQVTGYMEFTAEFGFDVAEVNVATPGSLATALSEAEIIADKIPALRITGTLNDGDLKYINTLPALLSLDIKGITNTALPDGCFSENKSLVSVVLPDGLTSIPGNAFNGCASLRSVDIPEGVASIAAKAFFNCSALDSVSVSSIPAWFGVSFSAEHANPLYLGAPLYIGGQKVVSLQVPYGVSEIKDYAFAGSFSSVTIPSTVSAVSASAFSGCGAAEVYCHAAVPPVADAHFTDFKPASVTLHVRASAVDAYREAAGWSAFTDILPFETEYRSISVGVNNPLFGSVCGAGDFVLGSSTDISATPGYGYHFVQWNDGVKENPRTVVLDDNKMLTAEFAANSYSVALTPSHADRGSVAGAGSFDYLSEATISATANKGFIFGNWSDGSSENPRQLVVERDSSLVAEFYPGGACGDNLSWFYNEELRTINIRGEGDMKNVAFGSNPVWYYLNSSATAVVVAEGVTSIGNQAFSDFDKLTEVSLPESLKSVGDNAFNGCSRLTSINLPDGVVSVGNYAFYNCPELKSVSIPGSVSAIGTYNFTDSVANASFSCLAPVPPVVDANSFTKLAPTASLAVLSSSLEAYKKADGWMRFPQFKALEGYFALNVLPSDPDMGSVSGQGGYRAGAEVSVSALPAPGCLFDCWSDGNSENPRSVVVERYMELTAHFVPDYLVVNVATPGSLADEIVKAGAEVAKVHSLKIIGGLNKADIDLLSNKNKMPALAHLDISEISNTELPQEWMSANRTINSINLPAGLTAVSNSCFFACNKLKVVVLHEGLHTIGANAFDKCYRLKEINIPASVTAIGADAFLNGSKLTHIIVDNQADWFDIDFSNKTANPLNTGNALYDIYHFNPDYIRIPYGVSAIKDYALAGSIYREIIIPSTVTKIATTAFLDCQTMSINSIAAVPPVVSAPFEGIDVSKVTLRVPAASVDLYSKAAGWKDFKNILPLEIEYGTVIVSSSDEAMGSVSGSGDYLFGSLAEVTATPAEGFVFVQWNDGVTENPRTFEVNANVSLTAAFQNAGPSTGVDNGCVTEVTLYANGNTLHVDGADQLSSDYRVLDATGRLVYSGRSSSVELPQGVYIVTIDGKLHKIAL